eukprot:1153699-Pelagomonas_calceolata.AAC.2
MVSGTRQTWHLACVAPVSALTAAMTGAAVTGAFASACQVFLCDGECVCVCARQAVRWEQSLPVGVARGQCPSESAETGELAHLMPYCHLYTLDQKKQPAPAIRPRA